MSANEHAHFNDALPASGLLERICLERMWRAVWRPPCPAFGHGAIGLCACRRAAPLLARGLRPARGFGLRRRAPKRCVTPAKAGVQLFALRFARWIPACAGMTRGVSPRLTSAKVREARVRKLDFSGEGREKEERGKRNVLGRETYCVTTWATRLVTGSSCMRASMRRRSLWKAASSRPSSCRPRGTAMVMGLTNLLLIRTSKWQCGPVDAPVEPTKPMIWPCFTWAPGLEPGVKRIMWP